MGKAEKFIKISLAVGLFFLLLRIFSKTLLPILLPFLFAFLTAWFLEPVITLLNEKLSFKRGFASAVSVLFLLFLLSGILAFLITLLFRQASGLLMKLPEILADVPDILKVIKTKLSRFSGSAPSDVRELFEASGEALISNLSSLPGKISAKALEKMTVLCGKAPKTVFSLLTYIIALFFISADYKRIKAFLLRQIPEKHRARASVIKRDLCESFLKWLRSELLLVAVTFSELFAAFLLLRVDFAFLLSLLIAFIDALPVLGTGTVLIPWGAVLLLKGETVRGILFLSLYAAVTVLRQFTEPKIVGGRCGVHPAAALFAVYAGFRLFGVFGMLVFPLVFIMLKELNSKGHLKLWR